MKIKVMRSYQRLYQRFGVVVVLFFVKDLIPDRFCFFVFVFRNVFCLLVAVVVSFASCTLFIYIVIKLETQS